MGWRDGWTFHPTDSKKKTIHEDHQLQEPDGHNLTLLWADFLQAIETKSEPVCGIEPSHRSSVLPMLGMLSYKLGRGVAWEGDKETSPTIPKRKNSYAANTENLGITRAERGQYDRRSVIQSFAGKKTEKRFLVEARN